MKELIRIISILLFFNPCINNAQTNFPGKPVGYLYDKGKGIPYVRLKNADSLASAKRKVTDLPDYKDCEYAAVIQTNISPANQGIWNAVKPDLYICRLGLTSAKASSLSVTMSPYDLKPGYKLFVYSTDNHYVLGAYTFRNVNGYKVLSLPDIPGDSIIIELQNTSPDKDFMNIIISSVGIGYPRSLADKSTEDDYYGWSADCHVDINCISDRNVQHQKYSVCRLIIERPTSKIRCTGTLMNNTRLDETPYILTAGHCINDEYSANRTIAYFDYESPYCDGPDGQIHSISGSTLRSRAENLDFSLVELSEKPPIEFSPLYAGWDATGDNVDTSYSIHHPEGDVKKYCQNDDQVQHASFSPYDPDSHWLIPRYSLGTTESGSSGAPLFNNDNRVVGTLTGGGLECTEYIYDYYQKLSNSWFDYMDVRQHLKSWLDPLNTGSLKLDNLDKYMGESEELTNISGDETPATVAFTAGWGYISGHNELHSTVYAEHFYRNGSKYIHSLNIHVSRSFSFNSNSKVLLKIWEGDLQPEREIFSKTLYNFELLPSAVNLIRLDTMILVDQHFFVGYEISYEQPVDTFAVSVVVREEPDSLNTAMTLINGNWQKLTDGNQQFNASLALYPLALDFYPPVNNVYESYPVDDVTIYPNPANGDQQLLFKEKIEGEIRLTVFDMMGNKMYEDSYYSPEPNIRFGPEYLGEGLYLLKVEYPGEMRVLKFIKQK